MIASNGFLRQLMSKKLLLFGLSQQCCRNIRCVSTTNNLQSNDFRKKTEKYSFDTAQNINADADIFGTLNDNVELNHKLDSLPSEPDDVIRYDKDENHKRLHTTEYHTIIQGLIKRNKV